MDTPLTVWCNDPSLPAIDQHVAFRGTWQLSTPARITLRLLGATWFVAWLDGRRSAEGPARFPLAHPEYQEFNFDLAAGRHVLAIHVNGYRHETRLLLNIAPFLHARIFAGGRELPVAWKCSPLKAFSPSVRRINPQVGSIEWCDTRLQPDWQAPDFDDSGWDAPVPVEVGLGPLRPLSSGLTREEEFSPALLAQGQLVEVYGYEQDNPSARFFLRELAESSLPSQGVWRRYDLGRVRLMRPRFQLDLPAGAVVEFAYAEYLQSGRVAPWINLSAGDSCNLDHYIARGGPQEFTPLTQKGGRFLEIHVLASPDKIKFIEEKVVDRGYYSTAQGDFTCGDPLLERIWSVGVETHRGCTEDALTDNPTRERGQWAGDVVTVGMEIAASAFNDLRLCRRGLLQCAQSAREDGLIAGLCPGGAAYLSTYAAQWISACLRYWQLTGDRSLLEEMFVYAERNIAAFEVMNTEEGLRNELGWAFVDWGYVRNPGPSDMGLNLHYLSALDDMATWCDTLAHTERATHYRQLKTRFRAIIARYFSTEFSAEGDAWKSIGYHRSVLGLRMGFFNEKQSRECVDAIKAHMLACFPNDPSAPRLSDPGANNPQLITPYFAHYAMPQLIERGEMDFVLAQYRHCWGWSLGDGRTTWLEVFDTRWSHCHQWAGCPTWQLSRYILGLNPRYDLGLHHYDLRIEAGSLSHAAGRVPLPGNSDSIEVSWRRSDKSLRYELRSPVPLTLHFPDGRTQVVTSSATLDA